MKPSESRLKTAKNQEKHHSFSDSTTAGSKSAKDYRRFLRLIHGREARATLAHLLATHSNAGSILAAVQESRCWFVLKPESRVSIRSSIPFRECCLSCMRWS